MKTKYIIRETEVIETDKQPTIGMKKDKHFSQDLLLIG